MLPASDDGIVVEEVGKGDVSMLASDVPAPLRERLGAEGTDGLLEILERTRDECVTATMTACIDRFERRLVETSSALRLEIGGLRQEMHAGFASLREQTRDGDAALKEEIRSVDAALREEVRNGDAALKEEMHGGFATLKEEIRSVDMALKEEIRSVDAALKEEMHGGFAALRQDLATRHAEQLKWSFLFWVGQVAVIAGLFGVLLRAV